MFFISKCKSRQFVFIAALTVFICTSTGVALAQPFTIEADVINGYNNQIERAQSVAEKIASSLSCIQTYQQEVLTQTNGLEENLGNLRKKEKTYIRDVARYEEEYKGYDKALKKEQENYKSLEKTRRVYEAKKAAERRGVEECKRQFWTINVTCEWANEFGKFVGLIDDVDGKLNASRIRADGAKKRYKQSYAEFTNSQQNLAKTQKESRKIESQINQAEAQIVVLKKQSSLLATQLQASHVTIDEFNETLDSAQNISTDDMKRRTLGKMTYMSEKIKDLMVNAPDMFTQANAVLPNNGRNCAH